MEWHIIIGILALVVLCGIYRNLQEDDDYDYYPVTTTTPESNHIEVTRMEETISTWQLAIKTIESIGSEPECKDEGRILFEYQGVRFLMETDDDCKFVNLVWPWCHSFSKFDIDEFARVRKVVNNINMQSSVCLCYSITDSDEVAVHMKKYFLFVEQIPALKEYLRFMLDCFFEAARSLDLEIEKCRLKECK